MIPLYSIRDDAVVLDFQLIYETDNRLMLDFYAHAAVCEGKVLGVPLRYSIPDYGMVTINRYDYTHICAQREKVCKNRYKLNLLCKDMINSIRRLAKCMRAIENEMSCEIYRKSAFFCLFNHVVNALAYREVSEMATEKLAKKLDVERLQGLQLPSYMQTFRSALKQVRTPDDVKNFIFEYGYLASFGITKNPFEMEKNIYCNPDGNGVGVLEIPFDASKCKKPDEQTLYSLTWYSEARHIEQQRALRDFRLYMKHLDMDERETDYRAMFL